MRYKFFVLLGCRHSFKVTRDLLLSLYDHTLEIRLWNTKDKLAPRARFDRPRAFRLPIPKKTTKGEALVERPEKFSVVGQQMERTCQRGKRRAKITKRLSVLSSLSEGESDLDLSISISTSSDNEGDKHAIVLLFSLIFR